MEKLELKFVDSDYFDSSVKSAPGFYITTYF